MGKAEIVSVGMRTVKAESASDGSERALFELIDGFSVRRAEDWLRAKFPSFDSSHGEALDCASTKNERDYFDEARLLGFVTTLADGEANRPLVVAAVRMKRDLTERTSRLVQFNYAKKVLQGAIAKGASGFSGIPSQGLFLFYDRNGFFRLSLVTAEVEKRKLKWNEAKRQSFYVEPGAANNIVRRRLADPIRSFADLKDAFSVEQLTKEFYRKLFDWYSWAMEPSTNVHFPNDLADDRDDRKYNNEAVIRLVTRLMFTWFIRQRKLVPDVLFDRDGVAGLLKSFDPDSMEQDNYYRAILQNLFFATFNCQPEKRRFIHTFQGRSAERHVTTLYRYEKEFKGGDGGVFRATMRKVPFLNCALFDCLDKKEREEDGGRELYFDGFSGEKNHAAHLPNGLFFDDERGIISLFNRYEFTVNENDADDSDVALDPELLGKVFENLLGAFNPETQETARKATGSFYTPREIVDYMVEESLKGYLRTSLAERATAKQASGTCLAEGSAALDAALDDLFDRNKAAEGAPTLFSKKEEAAILDALYNCRVLDPACGSGAFPMGVLHCMVRLLTRLDPRNISIRERLLKRYREDKERLAGEESPAELEARLKEGQHYPDYERKLYLIENCIYGVDIQPIATQISKLRFFISLLCDQLRTSYDPSAENFGLLSLPNLEAKFVCANTLVSLPGSGNEFSELAAGNIAQLRRDLQENRHKIFSARSTNTKEKYKARDLEIRDAIRKEVRDSLSKPDEAEITQCRRRIADARERRKTVAEPDWQEIEKPVQQDFFAPTAVQPMMIKIDRNADKREDIDREIALLEKSIAKEEAKASHANVSAAQDYADLVAGWDPFDQNASSPFFDPQWMFDIRDGFDVVIGNPPYISAPDQLKDAKLKAQRETLAHDSRFKCLIQKWDLYVAFVELSLRYFLRESGSFTMIVPYPLTNQTYGAALRRMLLSEFALKSIVDLQGVKVFENATVTNCIPVVAKAAPWKQVAIVKADENGRFYQERVVSVEEFMPDAKTAVWKTSKEENLLSRFKDMHRLGDYCYISKGMVINANEKTNKGGFTRDDLMSETKDKIHCREYIEAKDIIRYEIKRIHYLEYGTKRCPDGISRPTFPELYLGRRVLVNGFGAIQAVLDNGDCYLHNHTLYALKPWHELHGVENKSISGSVRRYCSMRRGDMEQLSHGLDLRLLLGILNSRMVLALLNEIRGGDFHILPEHLRAIPIPQASAQSIKDIAALVDRILAAKKADPAADTNELEAKIDALVYQLYGLTEEEIKVVEGKDEAAQEASVSAAAAPAPSRKRSRPAKQAEADEEDDEVLE